MKRIYTSIDIGSDSVKVIVCELYKNKLNLLAATSVPNHGVKKGLICDVDSVKKSVRKAITEIEEMLGITIKQVITTIPSYFSDFQIVNGKIGIKNGEKIITGKEVSEVITETIKNYNDSSREMI